MKKELKKEWIIKYAKKNGLDDVLNEKFSGKAPLVKRYSSEIQAICSVLSVLVIGIISVILSIQSNRISEMQLAVSKAEVKPIVTFSYEKDIISGIDRIKIKNAGTTPLKYEVEVVSFFDILANENLMGSVPIRIYTMNSVDSYNSIDVNIGEMAEIDLYNEASDMVTPIKSGVKDIIRNYTDLYWDLVYTYVIKVVCLDSLNETSEFYYMYNRWGGNIVSQKSGEEIFNEYSCMIQVERGYYTSKEAYFNLQDASPEDVFRYMLKKLRAEGLYAKDHEKNKYVEYGEYEPEN